MLGVLEPLSVLEQKFPVHALFVLTLVPVEYEELHAN